MVNYFEETKETFLTIKNRIFQSPKDGIFSKRAEPMLLALLDLIKITLEIMLSDFAEKKETVFDLKKHNFFNKKKSKTSHFSKGDNPCFWSKNANFFLI